MRKSILPALLLVFLLTSLLTPLAVSAQASDSPLVIVLQAKGPLTPAMAGYISRGIDQARVQNASLVVLQLDTPGGDITLMTEIVQTIRASSIPVVVYVAPNGAIAGSAGTLITLAGHVAAMAPQTAIGAASPVDENGGDIGVTMDRKIKEILKAQIRSLAAGRGEKAISLAEDTIEKASAVSAQEALDANLVDLIARDVPELLQKVDGRTVDVNGAPVIIRSLNARVLEVKQTFVESALQALTNPNIVFLLLAVGVQAILIELSSPGGWVAGFIGAVCVILAVYGMGILSVNWFGLVFLVLAFVLFVLDIKAPTHGALTAAGAASFVAGALVLFNSIRVPYFPGVSVPLVVGTAAFLALTFSALVSIGLRAMRLPVRTGRDVNIGRSGTARTDLDPRGTVQVGGEQWSAEVLEGSPHVKAGESVQVVSITGLRMIVRKVD